MIVMFTCSDFVNASKVHYYFRASMCIVNTIDTDVDGPMTVRNFNTRHSLLMIDAMHY